MNIESLRSSSSFATAPLYSARALNSGSPWSVASAFPTSRVRRAISASKHFCVAGVAFRCCSANSSPSIRLSSASIRAPNGATAFSWAATCVRSDFISAVRVSMSLPVGRSMRPFSSVESFALSSARDFTALYSAPPRSVACAVRRPPIRS